MTIQVPEGQIQEQIDSRLKSMSHRVKIDGFRPGKVPQSVIRKRFGMQVREEVLSEVIQSSFHEAIRDQQLTPVGAPQIVAHRADPGEGLEYQADFEIMPEFVPMPLEVLEVKRYQSTVSEEDVDIMIERLREQKKTWHAVERPADLGDRAIIGFEGWHGEESFTNGPVENFPVILGSQQMIPGFEEKLSGTQAGAKLEFELDFPESYPGEKMAGKTGRFAITVDKVEEAKLPEVDSEFAKEFGIEDGDLGAFRDEIRANMERQLRQALQGRTKASVMDQLYARNTFSLPVSLIEDELKTLIALHRQSARNQRQQPVDETRLKEQLDPSARRRVALALILGKIIDAYHLKADPGRVREKVEELALTYEQPEAVVHWYYAEKDRLRQVENLVMEDQIVDLVLAKARVVDEAVRFHDLGQAEAGDPSSQPA